MFSAFQTFGRLGAGARAVSAAWSPLALWPDGASSPGLWIDPPYTASLFSTSAGTTAISAIGTVLDTSNPVGLALDRKGGATALADPGIHLSQATSTSRPVVSAKKNELVGTAALATQNVASKALQYVLSFWGAGSVTLSGTSTAGPLAGTGAGDRVSLTFTPTAGTLTLTVSGTVTNAQLELGSVATTYQRVGATAADYDASAGPTFIRFDGVDDSLASATFAAGTLTSSMDCLIAVRRDSETNSACGLYEVAGSYSMWFGSCMPGWTGLASNVIGVGSSSTYFVDGVQLIGGTSVTADTLHTALTVGAWHVLEVRGLNLSTWTAVAFGGYGGGYSLHGALGDIQLFAAGQDANRDLARAQMAAYFGVTLP